MKFSLGMRRNNKALSFPELCALKEATDILMASPSGLANQARCAMAIKILGHNPVIKNDREYQEEIAKEELINFADLFEGIAVRPTVGRSMARYSSLVLPTTGQDVQNAELFNILNFAGLINAWALPRMTQADGSL